MSEPGSVDHNVHLTNGDTATEYSSSSPEKQQIQELHAQLQTALAEIGTLRQRAVAESHSQASLAGNGAEPSVTGSCDAGTH